MNGDYEWLAGAPKIRSVSMVLDDGRTERVSGVDGKWRDQHGREFHTLDAWAFEAAFDEQARKDQDG